MENTVNQQGRLSFELGWIVGFLEAEGCFSIVKYRNRKWDRYDPRITTNNTNTLTIQKCIDVLKALNIPHYVWHRQRKQWKPTTEVGIFGIKRCQKALNILLPHLTGKRKAGLLMKQFIESRLARNKGVKYTDEEKDCWRQIKLVNQKAKPSTTTR